MRACIVGGGLAGSLLAWRLARATTDWHIDLLTGDRRRTDATAASGGAVRCYEEHPEQRRLAIASMVELLGSRTLREWSDYREVGSINVFPGEPAALAGAVDDIELMLPGTVRLIGRDELHQEGWACRLEDGAAVLERHAGYTDTTRFRDAVLMDGTLRRRVSVLPSEAAAVRPLDSGMILCADREYDVVVLAAGAWTPRLLGGSGLPAGGYRTKSIQYAVYPTGDWRPPHFVDHVTGLYGRPTADGGLLLGIPTEQWDTDPDRPVTTSALLDEAARLARARFPRLRLGPATQQVGASDCYATDPILALRPVLDSEHRLFTFTGGSGGAAKTALAASHRAAIQLAGNITHTSAGRRQRTIMIDEKIPEYHTVGIGAGPANLSLAALFQSSTTESIALFERQPGPMWHNTLLHRGVRMQTSWLKDLVSLVDPRHELTFLNYLVTTGRMFALLNSQFDVIPRLEYVRYLAWAADRLKNINYGTTIDRISFTDDGFVAYADDKPLARSEHLVIGLGSRPVIPTELAGLPRERAFIADEVADRLPAMRADLDAPVAVVGGGQTGIEATMKLLSQGFTNISWFGRRLWFDTIDDSPSANDVYRPAHMQALQQLSPPTRRRVIRALDPTGDALTPGAMRALYQANYDGLLELGRFPATLYPGRDVTASEADGADIVLHCKTPEKPEEHRVRYVVIATGRENTPVPFDDDLRDRVEIGDDGELVIESDFSVRWKGMNGHKMFALNRARFSQGLTDANLTLLPIRAAMVLNSMFGREMFEIRDELCPVNWG